MVTGFDPSSGVSVAFLRVACTQWVSWQAVHEPVMHSRGEVSVSNSHVNDFAIDGIKSRVGCWEVVHDNRARWGSRVPAAPVGVQL